MDETFFPYMPLPDSLEQIAKLREEKFKLLFETVSGPQGFERSLERCASLAESLGEGNASDAFHLLSSINFLYRRCRNWETSERDVSAALREFLGVTDLQSAFGDNFEAGFKRLLQLVEPNPAVERKRKLRWLRTGILDNAINFSSFVDLRPSFSEDRKTIEEIIPSIILRIVTESDHGPDQAHVFQLTEDGLNKLRRTIDDISQKLSVVLGDEDLKRRIYKGNQREEGE